MSLGRLVVFGGTGFLGREVCRLGAKTGWSVTSISRKSHLGNNSDINYVDADVFDSNQYSDILSRADAVVDCIGSIMADANYKRLVNSPFSLSAVGQLLHSRILGPNPLANDSLSRLNTDSAALIAKASAENSSIINGRLPFVYVSAENWSQFADDQYIESKRNAEVKISAYRNKLRPVYIRPGFMYEPRSNSTCWPTVRGVLSTGISIRDTLVDGTPKGIEMKTVASAIIDAIGDDAIEGVVSGEALKQFENMAEI